MNTTMMKTHIRRQLLATVSAVALIGSLSGASADGKDTPLLWLEFGWHYEHMSGLGDIFDPPFSNLIAGAGFVSPLSVQRRMSYSYGGEGKMSFQPDSSDWIFTAAIRYGRAHSHQLLHQQDDLGPLHPVFGTYHLPNTYTRPFKNFSNTDGANSETHVIADFETGRDVGLGLLGASSQLSLGVRFAQMKSQSSVRMDTIPDYYFSGDLMKSKYHHRYSATARSERSFQGVGPSLSWDGSASLLGNAQDGEVALDWGANAALLFGRQKAKVHHQSTSIYYNTKFFRYPGKYQVSRHVNPPADSTRSRSVLVPNIGGFAGLSFRYIDAKISFGYRADFFFGAMDGGIDSRHSTTRGFHGPFASISVGMGD